MRAVAFELHHLRRRRSIGPGHWHKPDASIRQYPIHVKENDFDPASTILRRECHASILPIAANTPAHTPAFQEKIE
jgi:hypothetical protein